jgi:hypothetical protein
MVPALDHRLARQFELDRVEATIDVLTLAQEDPGADQHIIVRARQIIHECEAKMARYQAAGPASCSSPRCANAST